MTPLPRIAVDAGIRQLVRFGPARLRIRGIDPRLLQILCLGSFLTVGALVRDFSIAPTQVLSTFAAALLTQAFWLRRLRLRQVGYLSAIITGCGLSILVRADNGWVHPLVACVAISSKFVLRIDASHVFNPANLGALLAALVLPGAWVSPGQWGQDMALAGAFVAMGSLVTGRAGRLDIGWAFLAIWTTLVCLRVMVLGQPPGVMTHQLQSGALLLFAFFMISDPPTTPRHAGARLLYAAAVALLAFCWQYALARPNGLLVALFAMSPLVPWINRRMTAPMFGWRTQSTVESAP